MFVDVDGTLVNDRGLVPDSAREAIERARANGHLVFLCTGRSLPALWQEIVDIGFDGIVAAAGGYVEVGGTVLVQRHVPHEQVTRVVGYLDAHGIDYLLESNSGIYGSPTSRTRLRQVMFGSVTDEDVLAELERGLGGFIDSIVVGADLRDLKVNKVSFLGSSIPLDVIAAELSDTFDVIPSTVPMFGSYSGELSLIGVHKAAGIEVLIDHLGIDRERTVAFGDGMNDLEMLQFVAVGVAMGNAQPAVKAVADDVTGSVDEDGLHAGFLRHGLI